MHASSPSQSVVNPAHVPRSEVASVGGGMSVGPVVVVVVVGFAVVVRVVVVVGIAVGSVIGSPPSLSSDPQPTAPNRKAISIVGARCSTRMVRFLRGARK